MRALAEFVMRGRNQALGVCLIGALFPPLQGLFYAVISLVVLRKGMLEAGWVLIWACLPMLGYFAFNLDITPVYALASMVALAYVLKITASWAFTLAALVIFSIVGALIFEASASQLLNDYVGPIQRSGIKGCRTGLRFVFWYACAWVCAQFISVFDPGKMVAG